MRYAGWRAYPIMIARPTYVETKPAKPAPAIPILGAPRVALPKMKITQRTTLRTFIATAATRCTWVLPMPSKKALNEKVMAIEVMPRSRQPK